MPGFDGKGPQGEGPLTGRGEGYCAVSQPRSDRPYGFAGLQGRPIGNFFGRLWGRGRRAGGRVGRGGRGRGGGRGRW
jgi:hypothetical protein